MGRHPLAQDRPGPTRARLTRRNTAETTPFAELIAIDEADLACQGS